MEKPVTLVVTDLDGTLLNSEKKVSEKTAQAIRELKNRGILFGIASGRPVESGVILCRDWGIEDSISFLIGMNGGALYDTRRKEKETYADMDGSLIAEIISHYRGIDGLHFEIMVGNKRYVEWSSEETLENARIYGEEEIIVDLDEFLKDRKVDKLIIRSQAEQQPMLAEIAAGLHLDNAESFATSNVLYEFVAPNINKGYGLKKACEHFGLNLDHVVAFGDEANDREMLALAGHGVAMKNAVPAAKEAAAVTLDKTNDEDGLACYVEEVILPAADGKIEY